MADANLISASAQDGLTEWHAWVIFYLFTWSQYKQSTTS